MPLRKGSSPSTVSTNIREFHTGKSYAHTKAKFGKADADRQAVAVAMSEAGKTKGRAFGGMAPMLGQASASMMPGGMMPGGMPTNGVAGAGMPQAMIPGAMGVAAAPPGPAGSRPFAAGGGVKMTTGPLVSAVPGRTDMHYTHVPSGSYVIPADIVSGHGEGNTIAGMHSLHKLFRMGSHEHVPNVGMPRTTKFAKGGQVDEHVGKPVPVKLAGGEIVVPPENVHETMQRVTGKKMTLAQSHTAMDAWVLKHRAKLRKTLARLPGPSRD